MRCFFWGGGVFLSVKKKKTKKDNISPGSANPTLCTTRSWARCAEEKSQRKAFSLQCVLVGLKHSCVLEIRNHFPKQRSANYGPWAKFISPPIFVSKISLEPRHIHSFTYWLWLPSHCHDWNEWLRYKLDDLQRLKHFLSGSGKTENGFPTPVPTARCKWLPWSLYLSIWVSSLWWQRQRRREKPEDMGTQEESGAVLPETASRVSQSHSS